ncbi:MAG: oligosaccharide flippase family protein [Bacillota bacterium]|nr:oligosaccharide flippase family protein [Bacillota bacterium]
MSRTKLFLENFFVYGLGGIMSKVVPFIMLPVITRLMPSTFYYGLNDMSSIAVSFGTAIATMGMYDTMFRMFFEKEDLEFKKEVCSSTFYFVFFTGIITCIILILFRGYCSELLFSSKQYNNLLIISAISILVGTTNIIISAPTRMLNKRKIFLITNTISPVLAYSVSIPMLINKMYIMALPIASLTASTIILIVFFILNTDWFSLRKVNKNLIVQMLKLGVPLMPIFLVYWIFHSCDRIFISKLIGNAEVGIYGIGARVASISQFIYTAFAGGWQYFAFSTMKSEDQVELTSNIFEYLGIISYAAVIFLAPFSDIIFRIFFTGDYVKGSVVFPYLFLAPLLLMLFQTEANQFLVIKKTWPTICILAFGAVINIVLNYLLIPIWGIEGSAVATLIGYISSVVICSIVLQRMKLIIISKRFLIDCLLLIVYFIFWRIVFRKVFILSFILSICVIALFGILYKEELKNIMGKVRSFVKSKKVQEV